MEPSTRYFDKKDPVYSYSVVPECIGPTNTTLWVGLSIFLLLLLLVVSSFYAAILGTRINPQDCPSLSLSGTTPLYGVLPGLAGVTLRTCSAGECVFPAETLSQAVDICNRDPQRCTAFYYNNSNMFYLDTTIGTRRSDFTPVEMGGTYIRSSNITS